jgi:hypothetical protein
MLTLVACDQLNSKFEGEWEIEMVDADHCEITLDLEQTDEELEGEADIECTVYWYDSYFGEYYPFDLEVDGIDVEGEIDDDGEFDIELDKFTVTFYDGYWDSYWDATYEVVLEGEVDDGDIDGDVEVNGEDWGEIEGDLR